MLCLTTFSLSVGSHGLQTGQSEDVSSTKNVTTEAVTELKYETYEWVSLPACYVTDSWHFSAACHHIRPMFNRLNFCLGWLPQRVFDRNYKT